MRPGLASTDRALGVLDEMVAEYRASLAETIDLAGSPIERIVIATLMSHGWASTKWNGDPTDKTAKDLLGHLDPRDPRDDELLRVLRAFDRNPNLRASAPFSKSILLHADGHFGGPWQVMVVQPTLTVDGHRYRPDIAFISPHDHHKHGYKHGIDRVVVELDGHDFHERTKKQASHDKRRDRLMQLDGWKVLRYTGSDVVRDAEAIAAEVNDLLDGTFAYLQERKHA